MKVAVSCVMKVGEEACPWSWRPDDPRFWQSYQRVVSVHFYFDVKRKIDKFFQDCDHLLLQQSEKVCPLDYH